MHFLWWSVISSFLSALFPGRGDWREDRGLAGVGQIVWGWRVCCVMWQYTASSVPGGVAAPELPDETKKKAFSAKICAHCCLIMIGFLFVRSRSPFRLLRKLCSDRRELCCNGNSQICHDVMHQWHQDKFWDNYIIYVSHSPKKVIPKIPLLKNMNI